MDCRFCEKDVKSVKLYDMIGSVCEDCEEHADKVRAKYKKMLIAKSIESYPDDMDARDFDRMANQASLTYLNIPAFRKKMSESNFNPMYFMPSQFALAIKEQVINLLPSSVVSTACNSGAERWFSGGTYCFKNDTVPKELLVDAFNELQLWLPVPDELMEQMVA